MGILSLIERFKEKKRQLAERIYEKQMLAKEERLADRRSKANAISEARQLKREAKAKYIKEKYGSYKPFSQRVMEAKKSMAESRQKQQAIQTKQSFRATKASKPFQAVRATPRLLTNTDITTGQTGNIDFNFRGPNLGNNGMTRDIITGKIYKR